MQTCLLACPPPPSESGSASDLLHVLDPGLQQQDVLLQLVDFVCASPPAFQLILQHLLGLHQNPVVLL